MQIEMLILTVIIFVVMVSSGQISLNQLVTDNEMLFRKLKEEDYDFYVKARYGESVNPNVLFNQRIKYWMIVSTLALLAMITKISVLTICISIAIGFGVFKMGYINLSKYYKDHMMQIDSLLPQYLKGLEILIQHYTVPVAIGKSITDSPEIFKDGLKIMIDEINSGDDTITPYMNFAKRYPVRDSMRMMRLLYRLSLGRQERKQEQLVMFSRTISSLQQKARETRYANRLEKMENKTMQMLVSTGVGLMILLLLSVMQMMGSS
jgi:hypothetical protein